MIAKKIFFSLFGLWLTSISFAQNFNNDLFDLTKIRSDVVSKRVSSYDVNGGNVDCFVDIKDGDKVTLCDIKGSGIINHIWFTINPLPNEISRNDIILRMYWDGKQYPSVESPIGPFFGQGWNEQYNYASLPLAVGPTNGTGLVSYFAMPFSEGAKIEIENQSGVTIKNFYFYIDYVEMEKLSEDIGRFHAWYNHEVTDAQEFGENEWAVLGWETWGANKDGKENYVFADIKGKGHFVGVNYYVNNPSPMWYGEGDDMWFIDGETTASMIGTGTEDFFNTSWCPKEKFSHPYYGYPRVNENIGWLGRTHVYRFFITDPVFFQKSMKGTIEHGHNNCLTLDLATVAYWYQSEASSLPPAPSKETRAVKPEVNESDIHIWRDEWRKSMGSGSKLWGKEKKDNK